MTYQWHRQAEDELIKTVGFCVKQHYLDRSEHRKAFKY